MNPTLEHQLNHRTIRFFEDRPVSANIRQEIYQVINRTATSVGLQAFSVIRITDSDIKAKIAQLASQDYIRRMPELMIFIVDCYRNDQVARALGHPDPKAANMDRFFQGVADSYLAAQNAMNAIESMGLGGAFLGSILDNPQALVDLLQLPPLTFPLLGLGFGYPDDQPELKPRMPFSLKLGENTYPYQEDYLLALADYDQEMTHYYDTRFKNRRSDSFTNQVVKQIKRNKPLRARLLQVVESQGFDLGLDKANNPEN
ncbi:nitroreductase family protein [Ignavigranum ruoffiae]|uniref:nitroreductase family protein n=1 Tax=Ignavigranum ruoffiae TaxID=89093 RepID=UPI0024AE3688|nr:nitroreductase family protein [Ignavigranum ruoffiae]